MPSPNASAVGPRFGLCPKPSIAPHIAQTTKVERDPHADFIPYTTDGALIAFANKRKPDFHNVKHDEKTENKPEKQQKLDLKPPLLQDTEIPLAQHFSPIVENHSDSPGSEHHTDYDEHTVDPVVSPTQEWTQPAVADGPDKSPGSKSPTSTREPGTPVHELFKPPPHEGVPCTETVADLTHRNTIWIGMAGEALQKVCTSHNPTLGQLILAVKSLTGGSDYLKPLTAVGSDLALSSQVEDWQIALLREIAFEPPKCPRSGCERKPELSGLTRIDVLWNQMGWVAVDEMTYYLQWFDKPDHPTSKPLILRGLPDDTLILGSWIMTAVEKAFEISADHSISTAILIDEHWIPIHLDVSFTGNLLTFTTTSSDVEIVRALTSDAFGGFEFDIQSKPMLTQFPADCGFQILAFIIGLGCKHASPTPISPDDATTWRRMFAGFLHSQDKDQDLVVSIRLGGMPTSTGFNKLISLLESHGVAKNRSTSLAQHLIQAIGHAGIQSILNSSKQWRDLKAKASACRPPIQLILDDELQAQNWKAKTGRKTLGKKTIQSQAVEQTFTTTTDTSASQSDSNPRGNLQTR